MTLLSGCQNLGLRAQGLGSRTRAKCPLPMYTHITFTACAHTCLLVQSCNAMCIHISPSIVIYPSSIHHPSIHVFIHLPIYLSVYLSKLSIYDIYIYNIKISIGICVYMYTYIYTFNMHIHISHICVCFHLSACLPGWLSVCLSICVSISQSM